MSVSDHICPGCWRYGQKKIRDVFSEERKLQYSLEVEAALAEGWALLGEIPDAAAVEIRKKATTTYVTPEAVYEREKKTDHDVMAMVQLLSEACQDDAGKHVHRGATSYDIEDNRLGMQVRDASGVIIDDLKAFGAVLRERAEQYKKLPSVGRTHLQWAEPIRFGFKFAKYLGDVWDDYRLWVDYVDNVLVGKPMTGAVGTANSFVHLVGVQKAQRLSDFVMGKVGLKPALITDQVVSRKVYAEAGNRLTQAAMTGYKFAQDVYDLCRPEIGELMARTPDPEKVGSSAMPGKVVLINPIHAENAMSLARVVKGLASIGYDFIGLRQERSLDNSGGERVWIPQAFIYTDEVLGRCTKFAKSMVVREDAIARNLDSATRYSVTEPMLMMLVQKGMGRQEAHRELQRYAIALWERPEADPVDVLAGFDEISSRITPDELRTLTSDHRTYTGAAEEFIDRVLQEARF